MRGCGRRRRGLPDGGGFRAASGGRSPRGKEMEVTVLRSSTRFRLRGGSVEDGGGDCVLAGSRERLELRRRTAASGLGFRVCGGGRRAERARGGVLRGEDHDWDVSWSLASHGSAPARQRDERELPASPLPTGKTFCKKPLKISRNFTTKTFSLENREKTRI